MDMVKRFLEIKVNEKGEPVDVQTTLNYDIFVRNNLTISKNETFFNEHFGKHPVILIDYGGLCGMTDYEDMLVRIREIVKKTFLPHRYLLKNPKLFSSQGGKDQFSYYTHRFFYRQLDAHDITVGFHWLSRLLFLHFKNPVFVLIDEYNSYLNDLELKDDDKDRVLKFISSVNGYLLHSNDFIYQSLLTGTETNNALLPENIKTLNFLNNHSLWQYYGITQDEFDGLLIKLVNNDRDRNEIRRTCVQNYDNMEDDLEKVLTKVVKNDEQREKIKRLCLQNQYSYNIQGTNHIIYSFTLVLDIFKNKTKS